MIMNGLKVNLAKLSCNWCEADGVRAPHAITEDGWTDYACTLHAQAHFPQLFRAEEASLAPKTLTVGDRVRHVDGVSGYTAIVESFWAYPDVTVRWEDTGRTSTENSALLVPVGA